MQRQISRLAVVVGAITLLLTSGCQIQPVVVGPAASTATPTAAPALPASTPLPSTDTPIPPTATAALPTPASPVAQAESLHLGWIWPQEDLPLWPAVTVGNDGTFYVADKSGSLHALTTPGEEVWSVTGECGQVFPPVLSPDGSALYVVGIDTGPQVCGLTTDGSLLWTTPVENLIQPVPSVAPDGMLYLRTEAGVMAIGPDGAATEYPLPEQITSPFFGTEQAPVVDQSGNAYFALPIGGSVMILPQGFTETTECEVGSIRSNLVAYGDEGFAIAVDPGEIVAYDASCGERWRHGLAGYNPDNGWLALATGPDNALYAGGAEGLLLALTADGQPLWQTAADSEASDIFWLDLGDDGTIIASGDSPPALLAFNTHGETLLTRQLYRTEDTGVPAAVPGGGVAQVHQAQLEVYTSDPTLVIELPEPVPPPGTTNEAEAEIVQFMLDMIATEEIEGTLQYIEDTDWYGVGPTKNLIVWSNVLTEQSTEPILEGIPQLDDANPIKVWTYGEGELVEVEGDTEQRLAAIEDYRTNNMDMDTGQSIFAWGFYEFAIVSLDPGLQQAVVYRSASCGPLCGSGFLFTLERAPDGTWFVSESQHLWQA